MYIESSTQFRSEWRTTREEQRGRERERGGGPDYYVVRRHRLGGALIKFVSRALSDGLITPTKASKVSAFGRGALHRLFRVGPGDALSHGRERTYHGA